MSSSQVATKARKPRLLPPLVTGQEWVLVALIAALWIALGIATPAFLASSSVVPLLVSVAPIALIGVGMTFVMLTGGIDVSVGGMVMLTAVVAAKLLVDFQASAVVVLLVTSLVGAALGLMNGSFIAFARVHPIIVTFGTANLYQFFALRTFDSSTISGIPAELSFLGRGADGRSFGAPNSFLITCVVVAVAAWFLRHYKDGRHLYAVGGNRQAAVRAGIGVNRLIVMSYVTTGALAGFAANFVVASGNKHP